MIARKWKTVDVVIVADIRESTSGKTTQLSSDAQVNASPRW